MKHTDNVSDSSDEHGILWLVLDEDSQQLLQRTLPPRYNNTYYHHVTLLFGTPKQTVEPYIGQRHTIIGYAHAYNNAVQALRVRTPNLPDTYGVPHVTLSTAEGIEPFASVAMLQQEHTEDSLEPMLTLTGTVAFMPLKN